MFALALCYRVTLRSLDLTLRLSDDLMPSYMHDTHVEYYHAWLATRTRELRKRSNVARARAAIVQQVRGWSHSLLTARHTGGRYTDAGLPCSHGGATTDPDIVRNQLARACQNCRSGVMNCSQPANAAEKYYIIATLLREKPEVPEHTYFHLTATSTIRSFQTLKFHRHITHPDRHTTALLLDLRHGTDYPQPGGL
jgi:hypothetical protein